MDEEILLLIAKNNPYWFIKNINKTLFTKENIYVAVSSYGEIFEYVPKKFLDYELCLLAVKKYPHNIEYIPRQFITEELCIIALKKGGGYVFNYIPKDLLTEKVCLSYYKNIIQLY